MQIKGIAGYIADRMVRVTADIGQGRNAGCFGFVNEDGVVDRTTDVVEGGLNGLPLRRLLGHITDMAGRSLIEGLESLPGNTVLIMTRPGKTGLITDVSGVDFFNMPIIAIGVKDDCLAGAGIVYPREELFDLATRSEEVELNILAARTTEEEKKVLRASAELSLKYLEISAELDVLDIPESGPVRPSAEKKDWNLPRLRVSSIAGDFARELVNRSMEVGQGREVACMGVIEDDGKVVRNGEMVVGGIGYVPSRLLASSCVDIAGKSLRQIYAREIPRNGVIVHTHPGGTGVMHMGDAAAGPGSWGRPIVAIGHDNEGRIRGATVIENTERVHELADEDEELNLSFFSAETPDREAEIRNRKFGVAQEYTNLCKPIEIRA